MSKIAFFKQFLQKNKQVWAILPSSKFLAEKIIDKNILQNSEVIIEFWAGPWVFTEKIFEKLWNNFDNKKIFIIEKEKEFFDILIKKFPEQKSFFYNIDVLDLKSILEKNNIKKIDLVISWLPFKSLPKEIFIFLMEDFFVNFFDKNSYFIQFSYFESFKKNLVKYFPNIVVSKCNLNVPPAHIFKCCGFWK